VTTETGKKKFYVFRNREVFLKNWAETSQVRKKSQFYLARKGQNIYASSLPIPLTGLLLGMPLSSF
jgi:hypothetical protein